MKIFISSTRVDLQKERNILISFIDRISDCEAIAMEKFAASKHRPKDMCINELRKSDVLILILGFKYGSIDVEEGISFTEIEYNVAKELGKSNMPIFVFQKQKKGNWELHEENPTKKQKLIQFKARLDVERGRRTFETLDNLLEEVALVIINERNELVMSKSRLNLFISYEEFFKPFLKKENYFNHTYSFVGEGEYIKDLNNFVLSDKKIAIISGRGGIGKSRVLLEFSRDFTGLKGKWSLKFLNKHVTVSNLTLQKIPRKKSIIVIDDAHRYKEDEIFPILKILQKFPDYKLILTSRPYGLNYLKNILNRLGLDPKEIENLPEIKKVETDDLEKLAFEVLGEQYSHLTKPLVREADDSPLVIIVGGKLIKEKKIVPALLERQKEFQDVVFNKFEDELIGRIDDGINNDLYKEILSLISALSPINLNDNKFYTLASEFLKIESYQLIRMIDLLETSGILIRRENNVTITPDVLSDHILHNACLTTREQSTGYANRIFQAFWDYIPQNLLLNLSELDWRIKQVVQSYNLLSEIWEEIEHDFNESSNSRRYEILEYVERVAIFQPARVLKIVELTINSSYGGHDETASNSKITHDNLLYRLPSILENISIHLEYLTRCCEILWELGKNDRRQTNRIPSHPMRVLSHLAKYERYKDLSFNATVLDFVENCFKDPKNHEYYNSLFDIIDALLEKEETDEEISAHQITFYPFPIPYGKTKFIRERALALLAESIKINTTKTKLRVFKSLYNLLWPPTGHHNRKVSEKELDQWIPEIVEVLEIIENFVKTTKNPIVLIQVDADLRRVSRALRNEQCEKANYIVNLIPDSLDLQIIRALWDEYDKYDKDEKLDYFEMLEKIENIKKQLAYELMEKCNDIKTLTDYLKKKLSDLEQSGVQYSPDGFFVALSMNDYKVAQEICKYIISDTESTLTPYFSALLSGIRSKDKGKTIELSLLALETNDQRIIYSLAEGYAYRKSWGTNFNEDDLEIIKKLINHPDKDIINLAIKSFGIFPKKWHQLAILLALKIDIEDNQELANSICSVLQKNRIGLEEVRYLDIISILNKLVPINDINGLYYIQEFIRHFSSKYPNLVINFLFERILYSQTKESSLYNRYEPLPHDLRYEIEFEEHPNFIGVLRKVRNKFLDPDFSNFYISELFLEISDSFSPVSLEVLCEWIKSKNIKEIEAVGSLISIGINDISRQPFDFVFSNLNIVSNLLNNSYSINRDSYIKIRNSLIDAHFRFRKLSNSSEESEDDIIIRQSKKILKELSEKSPTREFYYLLCKRAKETIKNQVFMEEEFE